jgi:hypothetical protein
MNLKNILVIWLALSLSGCVRRNVAPGYEFKAGAIGLREARDYWTSHGRPSGFQPSEAVGPAYKYFTFTNVVRSARGILYCRFGTRETDWPPGVLAITDDGLVIFLRQRDGKVFFSPEVDGVEY